MKYPIWRFWDSVIWDNKYKYRALKSTIKTKRSVHFFVTNKLIAAWNVNIEIT